MYGFILNMWVFKRIDETDVQNYVTKGFISQQEANQILATPQDPNAAEITSVSAQ